MPPRRTDIKGFLRSRQLRHHLIEAETRLWKGLRQHPLEGVHFRRQHAIGPFIVDFCAPRQKLIIEVDGSQHLDQVAYDQERTAYLIDKGYRVIRFWNHEVMNQLDEVLTVIREVLAQAE